MARARKTEVRRQDSGDSKIKAEYTPKLQLSTLLNLLYNCRESSTNRPYYAKQTQFQKSPNERKSCCNKGI